MDQEKLNYEFFDGEPFVKLQSIIDIFMDSVELLDTHLKAHVLAQQWQEAAEVDRQADLTAEVAALFMELKRQIDVAHLNKSLET